MGESLISIIKLLKFNHKIHLLIIIITFIIIIIQNRFDIWPAIALFFGFLQLFPTDLIVRIFCDLYVISEQTILKFN